MTISRADIPGIVDAHKILRRDFAFPLIAIDLSPVFLRSTDEPVPNLRLGRILVSRNRRVEILASVETAWLGGIANDYAFTAGMDHSSCGREPCRSTAENNDICLHFLP